MGNKDKKIPHQHSLSNFYGPRPAQVGDLIEIVEPPIFGNVKTGDILVVICADNWTIGCTGGSTGPAVLWLHKGALMRYRLLPKDEK